MIYLKTKTGEHILVLEPDNIDAIKQGLWEKSGDKEVFVTYTPDAAWLGQRLIEKAANAALDLQTLEDTIKESQARPEEKGRPWHPSVHVIKDGKLTGTE